MKRHLNVQLVLQRDGILHAVDFSDYNSIGADIDNHIMLDFMIFKDELVQKSINLRHEKLNRGYFRQKFETTYQLDNDGTYTYYKFVIPTYYHFVDKDELVNDICDEIFYFEGNIYWYKDTINPSVSEILSKSVKLNSILEIYDIVFNNHATQTLYLPAKKVFSVCKLNKCLVSLQKQLLLNTDCNNPKKTDRDFLFTALYVFDYLTDTGNYAEAQRILDNLGECNYCQQLSSNTICNCG